MKVKNPHIGCFCVYGATLVGAIADKESVMDTCSRHKGLCSYAVIQENGNVQ